MKSRFKIAAYLRNVFLTEAAVISFIIAFHLSYIHFIEPNFNYQGFIYSPKEQIYVFIAFIFAILPSLILPLYLSKPSSFIIWLLYLMVYIPIQLIIIYTSSIIYQHNILYFQIILMLSMLFISIVPRLPTLPLPRFFIPSWLFWLGVLGFLALAYVDLFKTFGFQRPTAHLTDVYRVRLEARETLANAGRWTGYAMRWLSEAINPFLIAVGLSNRRWLLLTLGVVGQILIYSFDATKSTLGSILLIVAAFYLLSRSFRVRASRFVFALFLVFPLVAVLDSLLGQPIFTGLLTRRLFAVPGLLTSLYYDYFSNHSYFYWSHTIYAQLLGFTNIYSNYVSPGFLIGDVYFHNPAGNANANLWADGYANAGFLGIAIITLLLMLILWIYDSISKKKDLRVALLLIAMPAYAITNTSLLTSLLSHGWLPALLLMWYFPTSNHKVRSKDG